jgi:regulator of CtrA degradation
MGDMTVSSHDSRMHRRVIDTLYTDAMILADEARSYFDAGGRDDRDALEPMARVAFSCESLKVTTRLMHVIAWLLTQRAVDAGEMELREALDPARQLGDAPPSEGVALSALPPAARRLIDASCDLHRRVARLEAAQGTAPVGMSSPVHSLQGRLALAF